MIALGLTPWIISLLAWLTAPALARRLPGRVAVPLLTAFALAAASATGLTLAVLGLLALGETRRVATLAHWSASVLHRASPVPLSIGVPGAALVILLLAAATVHALGTVIRLGQSAVACRQLGPAHANLVVIDDDAPIAYTLPGLTGRIVVTTSLLRVLAPPERRALLAHEAAHLRHHHYLYVQLAELAAAANPLLRPVTRAVRVGVERWADDAAAAHTGDRHLVARTLAVAGLARAHTAAGLPAGALGAGQTEVSERVDSLLAPPRRVDARVLLLLLTMTACCFLSSAVIGVSVHSLIETAQAAYRRPR